MIKQLLCLTILLLCAPTAWGQEELTLEQAISLALQHNRVLHAAALDEEKAKADVAVARTYRLPQLEVHVLQGQLLTKLDFLFPTGVFGVFPQIGPIPPFPSPVQTPRQPFTLALAQANQPLSQLFRINLGVRLQELNRLVAEEKLRQQEQDIASQVKASYYDLLRTQNGIDANREAVKLFQELERVASQGLEQQAALKADVLEARAGLAKAELQAAVLNDTSATLKERLNVLMGRNLLTDFRVRPLTESDDGELDLAAARSRALEQRPEVRIAKIKLQEAEQDRRMKKAEYIPDVSLSFNYVSTQNVQMLPRNVVGAGLLFSWDVFDWGRKRQELIAKTASVEQARAALEETQQQVLVEVGHRFRKVEEARQQVQVATLAREADLEKLRVGLNRLKQQNALLKDVLQLQAQLAESTDKYQEALAALWSARADLEKAMGQR